MYIESFVKLQPTNAKGFYWKGMNYFMLKNYQGSADAMASCLVYNPRYPTAH